MLTWNHIVSNFLHVLVHVVKLTCSRRTTDFYKNYLLFIKSQIKRRESTNMFFISFITHSITFEVGLKILLLLIQYFFITSLIIISTIVQTRSSLAYFKIEFILYIILVVQKLYLFMGKYAHGAFSFSKSLKY